MSACTATTGPAAQCPHRTDGWRVKPLEWEDFDERGARATAFLLASYLIVRWSDERFEISVSAPGYSSGFDGERFHPTLEAAKAAAQAYYEARILAAIEPAAPTVAEAARVGDYAAQVSAIVASANADFAAGRFDPADVAYIQKEGEA